LYNARLAICGDETKEMNSWNFGVLTSKYVDNFPDTLPDCDKMRSIIDFQFESFTRGFFRGQMILFVFVFLIPLLASIKLEKGTPRNVMISISLVGAIGMYSFELMAMKVEGIVVYFSDKWNYVDQINFTLVVLLYLILITDSDSSMDEST
jgi:hypothetical protein